MNEEVICSRCNGDKQLWDAHSRLMDNCYFCQGEGKGDARVFDILETIEADIEHISRQYLFSKPSNSFRRSVEIYLPATDNIPVNVDLCIRIEGSEENARLIR